MQVWFHLLWKFSLIGFCIFIMIRQIILIIRNRQFALWPDLIVLGLMSSAIFFVAMMRYEAA